MNGQKLKKRTSQFLRAIFSLFQLKELNLFNKYVKFGFHS